MSELAHREARRTKRSDSTIIKLFVVAPAKLFRGDFIRGARLSASLRSGNKSISLQLKDKWHLPTLIKNPAFGRAPIKQKLHDVLNSPAEDTFCRNVGECFKRYWKIWISETKEYIQRIYFTLDALYKHCILYGECICFHSKTGLNFSALGSFAKRSEKRIPTIDNLKEHSLVKESD